MKTLSLITFVFAACASNTQAPPVQDGVRVSAEFKETKTRIFVTHDVAKTCHVSESRDVDLDKVAECLKGRSVQVSGELGISRADSVATYLERKGVRSHVSARTQSAPNAVSISLD